jgi:hypothetical protein
MLAGHRLELAGRLRQHLGEVERDVRRRATPRVGAREQQEVGDEAAHPA